jgi:hypothetical protein
MNNTMLFENNDLTQEILKTFSEEEHQLLNEIYKNQNGIINELFSIYNIEKDDIPSELDENFLKTVKKLNLASFNYTVLTNFDKVEELLEPLLKNGNETNFHFLRILKKVAIIVIGNAKKNDNKVLKKVGKTLTILIEKIDSQYNISLNYNIELQSKKNKKKNRDGNTIINGSLDYPSFERDRGITEAQINTLYNELKFYKFISEKELLGKKFLNIFSGKLIKEEEKINWYKTKYELSQFVKHLEKKHIIKFCDGKMKTATRCFNKENKVLTPTMLSNSGPSNSGPSKTSDKQKKSLEKLEKIFNQIF